MLKLNTIKKFFILTKPGIIFGNDITAIAGFFLASGGHVNFLLLLVTILGVSLCVGSACVFNNVMDIAIDTHMKRTKNRPLVTGEVSKSTALLYATILGLLGLTLLAIFTNLTTILVGFVGFFFYELVYGFSKRHSIWSTVLGSISGSTPPVAGYTAITGHIDLAAILLFLIWAFWQLPHFYAIAIYRREEYKAAGIPVLSVVKGVWQTKVHMLIATLGFGIASSLLVYFGFAGWAYAIVMGILSIVWLCYAIAGLWIKNSERWARKMFFFSLIISIFWCGMLVINAYFP